MITVIRARCMLDGSVGKEGDTRVDVVSVRGAPDAPLGEEGMILYHAGSKVMVVRRLCEIVGDGSLWGEVYLARTTFLDGLILN
jgi:hypothetical protein